MDNLVNDELAVGFDARFERRFVYLQWIGQLFLLAVVLLALFGFLGRGPFSHANSQTAGGAFSVDYEPLARYGTSTQVTLHVRNPPDVIHLGIDTKMIEPMGLQFIVPQPVTESADGSGVKLTFPATPGQDAFIRLNLKPSVIGEVPLEAHVDGEPTLRWSQFVLP